MMKDKVKVMLNGEMVRYDVCVNAMDKEIAEELHMELAPCTEQEFIDAYVERHAEKYNGEEFEIF